MAEQLPAWMTYLDRLMGNPQFPGGVPQGPGPSRVVPPLTTGLQTPGQLTPTVVPQGMTLPLPGVPQGPGPSRAVPSLPVTTSIKPQDALRLLTTAQQAPRGPGPSRVVASPPVTPSISAAQARSLVEQGTGQVPSGPGPTLSDTLFGEPPAAPAVAPGPQPEVPSWLTSLDRLMGNPQFQGPEPINEDTATEADVTVANRPTTLPSLLARTPGGQMLSTLRMWQSMLAGGTEAEAAPPGESVINPMQVGATRASLPGLGGQGTGPGAGSTISIPYDPRLPGPPTLPAAPQMGAPVAPDFSAAREALAGGAPQGVPQEMLNQERMSAILAGLAGGAAQVDATEAGSFARALATTGAGGSAALNQSQRREQDLFLEQRRESEAFALKQAGFESNVAEAVAAQRNAANEVAYKNALATYETQVKNAMASYEHQLQEAKLKKPDIRLNKNALVVSQFNPQTGKTDITTTPLNQPLTQLKNFKAFAEAMNLPGPAAESMAAQHIMGQYGGNPIVATSILKRMTVDRLLENGQGAAVFGKLYEAARKAAEAETPAAMAGDPELYRDELNARTAAIILNTMEQAQRDDWLTAAARAGSVTANILTGGPRRQQLPAGTQTAIGEE